MRSLVERIQSTPGWGYGKHEKTILKTLRKLSGVVVRPSCVGAKKETIERYEATAALIGPPLFKLLRDYGKGCDGGAAGLYAKYGTRGDLIPTIIAQPDVEPEIAKIWGGSIPSTSTIHRALRAIFGSATRGEDAETHLIFQTIGYEATYAGEVVAVDAFGLPCTVEGAWGPRGERRPSGARHFKRWVYAMVDMEAGEVWLHSAGGASESDSWPAAMARFQNALGFAPRACVCDQTAKLFANLRHMKAGQPAPLHNEVLAWFAAGVQGFTHEGKRPTAKAFIESTIRLIRSAWRKLDAERTLSRVRQHKSGEKFPPGAMSGAWYASEADFQSFLPAWESEVNTRILQRAARPRSELWTGHAESVAWRSERQLAADAGRLVSDICARHRVLTARGRMLTGHLDGKPVTLELDKESPLEVKPNQWPALVIPMGLRAGDDPEGVRIFILQQGPVPKFHAVQAHAGRNYFGRIEGVKPKFGEGHKSMPWTEADRAAFNRDAAAKVYTKGLKEGTNDAPVVGADSPF